MRHQFEFYSIFVLLFFLAYISRAQSDNEDEEESTSSSPTFDFRKKRSFSSILHRVAFGFASGVRQPNQNLLISPTTLSSLYGLVYAVTDGQTKKEINEQIFVGWQEQEIYDVFSKYAKSVRRINAGGNVELVSLNKMAYQRSWAKNELPRRDSNALVSEVFKTTVDPMDFVHKADFSRSQLNRWLLERTFGRIRNFFGRDDLTAKSAMVAASVASLEGNFTYGFDAKNTEQRLFYPSRRTAIPVKAMTQTCARLFYSETRHAVAVGLPYGLRRQLVAYFIMPKRKFEIMDLEYKLLEEQHLAEVLKNSMDNARLITVTLPKFRLDFEPYDVRSAFLQMGTTTMFADGFANFSRINSRSEMHISNALHKSVFEVHEGTARLCPSDEGLNLVRLEVNFNHPFVVAIIDKSNRNLLFYGRVTTLF